MTSDQKNLKKLEFDAKDYYQNIKDLLRYESELADRRLRYLLTLQTCLVGGHVIVEWIDSDLLGLFIPLLGLFLSLIMFCIQRKGLLASQRIAQRWKGFETQYAEGTFPPVWGVKGYGDEEDSLFKRIFGVSPEYYVLIPIMFAMAWLLIWFASVG